MHCSLQKDSIKPAITPTRLRAGFTLTETLVVIVIVAVLAMLAFIVTSKAIAHAHRVAGLGIHRQFGVATGLFIADNNGHLPGPIAANGQLPNYQTGSSGTLFGSLYPYLGLPDTDKVTALPDSLVCPAFRRRYPGWNANGMGNLGDPGKSGRYLMLNQDLRLRKANGKLGPRVFGRQSSSPPDEDMRTQRYEVVSQGTPKTPISKIFMLWDFDIDLYGDKVNILFMDFHAESLTRKQMDDYHKNWAWPD